MGGVYLNEQVKKELNRIRPNVKPFKRRGTSGVAYSDIIGFLVKFYKEAKKNE